MQTTLENKYLIDRAEKERAVFILAHGAGTDMKHHYLTYITELLNKQGVTVIRFNFPYMDKRLHDGKRRPPDKMPTLITCYKEVIKQVLLKHNKPLFIAGKSMGGRVAATLANDIDFLNNHLIKGVICIGYPFHPAKRADKLRLEPLQKIQLPVVIFQGERDVMGSKDEIAHYQISSQCALHFSEDGDHDLKPRVKSGFTHEQHLQSVVAQISEFIDEKR